jgi:hypothetical protein
MFIYGQLRLNKMYGAAMDKKTLKLAISISLFTLLIGSLNPITASQEFSRIISASGSIVYRPLITVMVDLKKLTAINNFSLGFQAAHYWKNWRDNSDLRDLAKKAGFKLIREFEILLKPCISWDEATKTGRWNWADVDLYIQRILEVGAEPLICLGYYGSNGFKCPNGMAINPVTGLPYPESYAAYAREWVRHFKEKGLNVRFYEILNEPWSYFGRYDTLNYTKLDYFIDFFNATATAMRQEDSKVLVSYDASTMMKVLDYWLVRGPDLDFLDFHFYGASSLPGPSDEELFRRAEQRRFEDVTDHYGVDTARRLWLEKRGKLLPVICSEGNLNAACTDGTDPRIQQMVGAVWTALVLRMCVLKGLSFNIYYQFASSESWEKKFSSGGLGFGMVNLDNNMPYYPYYVQKWLGTNLAIGDIIVECYVNSSDFRVLAWIHNDFLNVLLISKTKATYTVLVTGIDGQITYQKIEDPTNTSYLNPQIQEGVISTATPIIINGYAVALLQIKSSNLA